MKDNIPMDFQVSGNKPTRKMGCCDVNVNPLSTRKFESQRKSWAEPYSLEILETHLAEEIWLWRHRTTDVRPSVQALGEGEGRLL